MKSVTNDTLDWYRCEINLQNLVLQSGVFSAYRSVDSYGGLSVGFPRQNKWSGFFERLGKTLCL